MLRLGITGGLGAGKSTVAAMVAEAGCPVFDADAETHRLLRDHAIAAAIAARFGGSVLAPDGTVDRKQLAAAVFAPQAAASALADLNALLHPPVLAATAVWMSALADAGMLWAAADAALLFEANRDRDFDAVALVVCDETERIRRWTARTGNTESQARARMVAQLADAAKRSRARFVVDNNGSVDAARTQVVTLMAQLRREAHA